MSHAWAKDWWIVAVVLPVWHRCAGWLLMDVLCPRDSKTGTGAAIKCHPQVIPQPVLSLPVLWQPSSWAHLCLPWDLLPLWVVALRLLSALLGRVSGAAPAQPCSSTASHNSNTLPTERCLRKQDKFWDICRKSSIRVFLFCNDFHFSFQSRKSRAYTGH